MVVILRSSISHILITCGIFASFAHAQSMPLFGIRVEERNLVSRATVTGCATVDVSIPITTASTGCGLLGLDACTADIDIGENLCLCLNAGVLTPNSIAAIGAGIKSNTTLLAGLQTQYRTTDLTTIVNSIDGPIISGLGTIVTGLLGGVTGLVGSLVGGLLAVPPQPVPCSTYPDNSVPLSCGGSCAYSCASGYYSCGNQCILNTKSCISGVPVAKRQGLVTRRTCPQGTTACGIATGPVYRRAGFECINVQNDIESCGGCLLHFGSTQAVGRDCTDIPHVDLVSCVAGKCIINKCQKGYENDENECVIGNRTRY